MSTLDKITKEEQRIARLENSLAREKLKKRKQDTRNKIEWGGLVVKSGMNELSKDIILGALIHATQLIENDPKHLTLFEGIGKNAFLNKPNEGNE